MGGSRSAAISVEADAIGLLRDVEASAVAGRSFRAADRLRPMTTSPSIAGASADSPRPADASSSSNPALAKIERLRSHRVRPPRETGIGGVVASIRREASRHQRQAGSFVEAWESVIPGPLRRSTRVGGLRGGIARIGVRDAATRYELEVGLRGGWMAQLRLACGDPIRRVQCSIDAAIDGPGAEA